MADSNVLKGTNGGAEYVEITKAIVEYEGVYTCQITTLIGTTNTTSRLIVNPPGIYICIIVSVQIWYF